MSAPVRLLVGGYGPPHGGATGLSLLEHDGTGAGVTPLAPVPSPSFVVVSRSGDEVFCVEEAAAGWVHGFRWRGEQALEPVASASTEGGEPCHLAVHPAGLLLVANYASGSVSLLPIGPGAAVGTAVDVVEFAGSGPHPRRQRRAHAHHIAVRGAEIAVADLGADRVWRLLVAGTGARQRLRRAGSIRCPPGSGPRQVEFLSDDRVLVLGELDGSLSVAAWPPPSGGAAVLRSVPGSAGPLPAGTLSAALVPGGQPGRWLVSHRGADVVSSVDVAGDRVSAVRDGPSGGRWPRHLAVARGHRYVANQSSDAVAVFACDGATAPLMSVAVPAPTCVVPLPDRPR